MKQIRISKEELKNIIEQHLYINEDIEVENIFIHTAGATVDVKEEE